MKHFNFAGLLALLSIVLLSTFPAHADPVGKQKFTQVFYLSSTATSAGTCKSYSSPCTFVDRDLMAIPAGTVIEKVFAIVDVAITGTTNLDVGDDDDADGFLDGSLSVTLGTPGMYGWDVKSAGAYLRILTAGVTDPADPYVVPNAKYYASAGKEVKLDITTANTAGKARIFVEGFYVYGAL